MRRERAGHPEVFKKYYLHGETIVASVALDGGSGSSEAEEELSKSLLYQEIGVKVHHEQQKETQLSKYFKAVK